jgi:PAS domain S-box-containing protein
MKVTFNLAACVAVGAVELALATLGVVAYRNTGQLAATTGAITHGHVIIERAVQVLARLDEAEADERAYILTGDPRYLEPCNASLKALDEALADLEDLTRVDPDQPRGLGELREPLSRTRHAIQEAIHRRDAGDLDAGRTRVLLAQETTSRDEVGQVTKALADTETARVRQREDEAAALGRDTRDTILLGHGLLVVVLAFAGAVLYSQVRGRRLGEERYRRLVEMCPDAILLVRDGRVVFANGAGGGLLGGPPDQLVGRSPFDLVAPESSAAVRDRLDRVLVTGQPAPPGEVKVIRRDGSAVDVELVAGCFPDGDGTSLQMVLHDVSPRKELEARSLRAQRLESIGTLAGGIAHDLNNVLTPILMAAQLLHKDRPEAQRQELLSTVQASAERGADLVRQLLSFAGGAEGAHEAVSLRPVVREVEKLLTHTLPKSIRLRVEVAPDPGAVSGDPTQLAQVLMNLCVNARDAMPQGGTLTVGAATTSVTEEQARLNAGSRPGPHVVLSVTDTGGGIAPEIIDRIFDPFFTTKERGKGTGLGLSTVLGIVRSHGGFVNVYTEPGKGSRFTIYLPALEKAPAAAAPPGRRDLPEGRGEVVLVIDDEQPILVTARATLEAHGYRVLTAARGAEGVEVYRKSGAVRAVLLDMMMPGLDGPATMRRLLEIDPRAQIIAASGLKAPDRVAAAVAAGAINFLPKPYTDEQLLRALAEILRHSGEQPEAPAP